MAEATVQAPQGPQANEQGAAAEKTESLWKDVWYSLR